MAFGYMSRQSKKEKNNNFRCYICKEMRLRGKQIKIDNDYVVKICKSADCLKKGELVHS